MAIALNYKGMLSFDRDIFSVFFWLLTVVTFLLQPVGDVFSDCRENAFSFNLSCDVFSRIIRPGFRPDFAAFVGKIPVPVSSFRQLRIKRRKSSAQDRPFHEWKRMNGLCRRPFRFHRAGQGKKGMSGKHFLQDGVFRK